MKVYDGRVKEFQKCEKEGTQIQVPVKVKQPKDQKKKENNKMKNEEEKKEEESP